MSAPSFDELLTQATLIFRGRVKRVNASTMPAVPASERTGVVTVEEVLTAPPVLGDLTSSEVTVQFEEPAAPEVASQAVFFTRPWLYGDTIAVIEVGRTEVAEDEGQDETAHAREEISAVTGRDADRALQGRLSEVDAVVAGRVVNTHPSPIERRVSEHDPQLHVATIAIESVEMGSVPQPTAKVVYAASFDVMWFRSPKLDVGREGIWLLQRGERQSLVAAPATAWTCLDPRDELATVELDTVRSNVAAIERQR